MCRRGSVLIIFLILPLLPSCLTYSSYQSARTVEPGQSHATLGVSRSGAVFDEDDDEVNWWTFDGDVRFGITSRVDGSIRMSIFHNVPEGWGGAQFTVDGRVGIIRDYLTAAFPFSVNMGDFHFYTLRFQPGFVGTVPLGDRLEVNGAVRAHIYLRIGELTALGYNFGLGIRTRSGEWTIRPEVGWLVFSGPDDNLTYFQYGVGIEHHLVPWEKKDEDNGDDRILDSLIDR